MAVPSREASVAPSILWRSIMRRLLLGVALLTVTVAHPATPSTASVAVALDDCYYYEVDVPPYGSEVRVCPPPPSTVRSVIPGL
jgi:hypothetical protein